MKWLLAGMLIFGNAGVFASDDPDPWEPANRRVFAFNDFLDRIIVKPVAKTYKKVLPKPIRRGIGNIFTNLETPSTAINQFLQGKPGKGFSDTGRFLVNTTIGIGGIFDVASPMGFEKHTEDFGQTFAVWGAKSSNHVMIPFRGSSTVRDSIGLVFDAATNPLTFISPNSARYSATAVYAIDARVGLLAAEELLGESGDKYLFLRDAYLQRRAYLVSDGEVEEDDPFLDEDDDDE